MPDTDTRTRLSLSEGSYVHAIVHTRRSHYLRCLIDERLSELRAAVDRLHGHGLSSGDIEAMVAYAELPAREALATAYGLLCPEAREAVDLLAAECDITGQASSDLLDRLRNGARA